MKTFDANSSAPEHLPSPDSDGIDQIEAGKPATALENFVTLFGGIWLVVGLFIDGYAHSEIIDTETEDFFTPWHGIFYSGFLFVALAISWIVVRRSDGGPARSWIPPGYGWSVVGTGVFAIGGLGDGIWHTVFGVENGIDALLSPTHLLLYIGMALILLTPFRSFWLSPATGSSWSETGGAVASISITSALTVFFFTYVFGLSSNSPQTLPFDPITERNEGAVEIGLATAYVATMLLVVPLLVFLRRSDLPVGGATVILGIPVLLEFLAFDGESIALLSVVGAGVLTEIVFRLLAGRFGRRRAIITAVGLGVTGLWSIWMALTHVTRGVAWMPELWSGQIVMCGILATGLAAAVFTPPILASAVRAGLSN